MPTLQFQPAIERLDLLSPTIAQMLQSWSGLTPIQEILVAEIDPAFTGSAEFCKAYNVAPEQGSNCVIVEAIRGANRTLAACVAPISCRMDINRVVKKTLGARRVSFARRDEVLELTGMEYGGIAPFGLPEGWPILLDKRVSDSPRIITGAGTVRAKLSVPGNTLMELPGARVVENLGVDV